MASELEVTTEEAEQLGRDAWLAGLDEERNPFNWHEFPVYHIAWAIGHLRTAQLYDKVNHDALYARTPSLLSQLVREANQLREDKQCPPMSSESP